MASGKSRRRKKRTRNTEKRVLKSREQMMSDEYIRLVEKGRVSLHRYLCLMAKPDMSERSKEALFRTIEDEYRYRMDTSDVWFSRVNEFLFDARMSSDDIESSIFWFGMVRDICASGRVKEVVAARYPELYRLKEQKRPRLFRQVGSKSQLGR